MATWKYFMSLKKFTKKKKNTRSFILEAFVTREHLIRLNMVVTLI